MGCEHSCCLVDTSLEVHRGTLTAYEARSKFEHSLDQTMKWLALRVGLAGNFDTTVT